MDVLQGVFEAGALRQTSTLAPAGEQAAARPEEQEGEGSDGGGEDEGAHVLGIPNQFFSQN